MNPTIDREALATTFTGRLGAPFRRGAHRLLRPALDRIQELVAALSRRQDADRTRIERLEHQVANLQACLDAARPLLADYLNLIRRLGMVESQMLRELSGTERSEAVRRATKDRNQMERMIRS